MSKIVDFESARVDYDIAGAAIKLERSEEFNTIAHRVGDILTSLPLTNAQHNELVEAIVDQVNAGEHAAFKQGFDMGMKVMKGLGGAN